MDLRTAFLPIAEVFDFRHLDIGPATGLLAHAALDRC
jgi:hypothetical protein